MPKKAEMYQSVFDSFDDEEKCTWIFDPIQEKLYIEGEEEDYYFCESRKEASDVIFEETGVRPSWTVRRQ